MRRTLITSALAVLVFTVLLGVAYPLAITGVAQLAFGAKADGDPTLLARDVIDRDQESEPPLVAPVGNEREVGAAR